MKRFRVRGLDGAGVTHTLIIRARSPKAAILNVEGRGLQPIEVQQLSPSPWSTWLWITFALWTLFITFELFDATLNRREESGFWMLEYWFLFSIPIVYGAVVMRWRIN